MGEGIRQQHDWSGSRILRRTVIPSKRCVIGNEDVLIPTDLREWVAPPDSQEIKHALASLDLPMDKKTGSFDRRARRVWRFVIEHVSYRSDAAARRRSDFWQFPAETLALGEGDCEDCAFLLATLLLGAGISPFCVRVVLGTLATKEGMFGHAWPAYKDEGGRWRVLESTLANVPRSWPLADDLARADSHPRYDPEICLNQYHVWSVTDRRIGDMTSYLSSRKPPPPPGSRGINGH